MLERGTEAATNVQSRVHQIEGLNPDALAEKINGTSVLTADHCCALRTTSARDDQTNVSCPNKNPQVF
jgi:hypothetical protein